MVSLINTGERKFVSRDFVNGTFKESFDATVASNGTTITMSLEQSGTGDLTMQFSDGDTLLDCTPAKTLTLTPGTDAVPVGNYVYILQSDKTLQTNTAWPSAEHIRVAFILCQSAITTQTRDPLINQNWNDHLKGTDNQGHLSHITAKIRQSIGATYGSGVAFSFTAGPAANIYLTTTSGVVDQMHSHTFPATEMPTDDVHVVNQHADDGGNYNTITDLASITDDSESVTLSNKYFNVVFFGVANKTGEEDHIMALLPSGGYTVQSDAENDVDNYTIYTIPSVFTRESGTAFYICEALFKWSGGLTNLETIGSTDLRGRNPDSIAGGGTGTALTEFADTQFKIFDDGDATKILQFEASSLSAGTTTITVPDGNDTMAVIGKDNAFTATQTFTHDFNDKIIFNGNQEANHTILSKNNKGVRFYSDNNNDNMLTISELGALTNFISATATGTSGDLLRANTSGTARGLVIANTGTNKSILVDNDLTDSNDADNTLAIQSNSIVTDAGTYTKSNSVLKVSSAVTETSGTITDTAKLLELSQTNASSTGDVLTIANSGTGNSLALTPTGDAGSSESSGGAFLISNTGNMGSGLVIYTNHASSTEQLLQVGSANSGYTGTLARFWQDGSGKALLVDSGHTTTTNDITAFTSASPNATTVGIGGAPDSKGVVKITHNGVASDGNSAGLSIDLAGSGTASQGLFIDATNGGTTGNLLTLKNAGAEKFIVDKDGDTTVNSLTTTGNITIDSDTSGLILGDDQDATFSWDNANSLLDLDTGMAIGGTGQSTFNESVIIKDKLSFTQTDNNEYIDSLADGELSANATTSLNFMIGGTEQVQVLDGIFQPTTTNDIDLGTSSLEFKDGYFTADVRMRSLVLDGDEGTGIASTITMTNVVDSEGDTPVAGIGNWRVNSSAGAFHGWLKIWNGTTYVSIPTWVA